MIIYYNPECSKCREAKELLDSNSCEFEIRNYLNNPLNETELVELLRKLNLKPFELIRKSEPFFIENFNNKKLTDKEWIGVLMKYPLLMERPIVMQGNKAIIGRPPILVLDLVKEIKE